MLERLTEELYTSAPEIGEAWKQEARHRLAEIDNGTVQTLDGNQPALF